MAGDDRYEAKRRVLAGISKYAAKGMSDSLRPVPKPAPKPDPVSDNEKTEPDEAVEIEHLERLLGP